jgi:AhpD family alkylhydroperoxidase
MHQEDVMKHRSVLHIVIVAAATAFVGAGAPAFAADPVDPTAATLSDIKATLGMVPEVFSRYPKAALPGAWQSLKALELSGDTALTAKTKDLIGLAVAAQIPCNYCVLLHTMSAKQEGATDAEIGEAIAVAGMTRNWSTVFNGMQIDFAEFKKQVSGGEAPSQ